MKLAKAGMARSSRLISVLSRLQGTRYRALTDVLDNGPWIVFDPASARGPSSSSAVSSSVERPPCRYEPRLPLGRSSWARISAQAGGCPPQGAACVGPVRDRGGPPPSQHPPCVSRR